MKCAYCKHAILSDDGVLKHCSKNIFSNEAMELIDYFKLKDTGCHINDKKDDTVLNKTNILNELQFMIEVYEEKNMLVDVLKLTEIKGKIDRYLL